MIIGSITENLDNEKRISITPEIAKKYIDLGFNVQISKNYGVHLGFSEKEYVDLGVKFFSDNEIINNSDTMTSDVFSCDSYSCLGTIYTSSGIYDSLFTTVDGCDS